MPTKEEKQKHGKKVFDIYIERIENDIKTLQKGLNAINKKEGYREQRDKYDEIDKELWEKLNDTISAIRFLWKRMGLKIQARMYPGEVRELCEQVQSSIEAFQVWDNRFRLIKLHEAVAGIIEKYQKLEEGLNEANKEAE